MTARDAMTDAGVVVIVRSSVSVWEPSLLVFRGEERVFRCVVPSRASAAADALVWRERGRFASAASVTEASNDFKSDSLRSWKAVISVSVSSAAVPEQSSGQGSTSVIAYTAPGAGTRLKGFFFEACGDIFEKDLRSNTAF